MTAIIGHCLEDGFFLAADSRRTDVATGNPYPDPVQKIISFGSHMVLSTGGLGTQGHQARDEFLRTRNPKEPLEQLVTHLARIFRETFAMSQREFPGHQVPLYAVLAGRERKSQRGFLCAIKSVDDFKPFWIRQPHQPYFTGSNTALVQSVASRTLVEMTRTNAVVQLDSYAVEAVRRIAKFDSAVGFPVQMVLIRDMIIETDVADPSESTVDERFREKVELRFGP